MSNWRNPDDYAYMDNLTCRAWAWEFLRRNEKYCRAWSEWGLGNSSGAWPHDKPDHHEAKTRGAREASRWGLWCAVDPACRADQLNQPAPQSASRRVPGVLKPKPKIDFVFWRTELLSANVFALNRNHVAETLLALPTYVELIGFNLRKPIDPQMKQARRVINTLKKMRQVGVLKPETKGQQEKWRLYLRTLDGDAQGARQKEIAAVLLDNPAADKRISDTLCQANRLVEEGYKRIIPLDDKGEPRPSNRKRRKA